MMTKLPQRFLQRSQSGQSLVILAIGFIALLGFVGIVTDVSLMFVRYTSLTRAVDAASIAAAGQVRRQVPFQSEVDSNCTGKDPDGNPWTRSNPCTAAEAAAFARSFGNVGVAARQFIEFYGLDPQAVLIDMCFTVSQYNSKTKQLEPIPGLEEQFSELCQGTTGRNNERKLIKVTAQIDSPTVFLRLLGFPDITLEASSISETAVLDVVLIMDVSESMLNQTTYETWADAGYNYVYLPPDIGYSSYYDDNGNAPGKGFGPARKDKFGNPAPNNFADLTGFNDYNSEYDPWFNFRAAVSALTPGEANNLLWSPSGNPDPFDVKVGQLPGKPAPSKPEPRTACRVAYYPYSFKFNVSDYLNKTYQNVFGEKWQEPYNAWSGYVPTYNFYRCCNDPNGDGLMDDLLCEPFRSARDATEQFIQRVDFLRGDRVAFVTFDQQAFLVNVEVDPANNVWSHMIDNEQTATNTLKDYIGVRTEPSFYEPTDLGGGKYGVPWVDSVAKDGSYRSHLLGAHDYDVPNNCPFQDASLPWPWSPVSAPNPSQAANYGFTYDSARSPNLLAPDAFAGGGPDGNGQRMFPRGTTWESAPGYGAYVSYDLWASCRGTNIGAALREGSNALVDPLTTRTDGSVWVMVMLSDGAAGASDPVFDSRVGGLKTEPSDLYYPYNDLTYRVTYGGFGVCPVGNRPGDTQLSTFTRSPFVFPFCSDPAPETRHFCFNPQLQANIDGKNQRLWVDLGQGDCNPDYYDVDDYARDWADWIGLAEPPGAGATAQRNITQLPTIFTIGFGLNFSNGTTKCKAGSINAGDESDCLGEELLRYIADVGDNFRLDTDYEQYLLNQRAGGGPMTNEDFGPRGECEEALADPSSATFNQLVDPKKAGLSCGNYYNAPAADELQRVFDDIASRMFTRLTQ